ncbi:MAG: hypothetical protein Q4A16_04650 [Lautropia sp.]|nr:hypothetical protein [Lautropia sp.]
MKLRLVPRRILADDHDLGHRGILRLPKLSGARAIDDPTVDSTAAGRGSCPIGDTTPLPGRMVAEVF